MAAAAQRQTVALATMRGNSRSHDERKPYSLPLLWLSLARWASSSRTRASSTVTCSRNTGSSLTCACSAAFSASNWALRACGSGVMPLGYTCCASPADLLPYFFISCRKVDAGDGERVVVLVKNRCRSGPQHAEG